MKDPEFSKAKKHHPNLPDVQVGVRGGGKCLLMISPRQTGKSTIISNLFLSDSFYGQDFFPGGVIIISPTINSDVSTRFLKQRFETYDTYSPELIQSIIRRQQLMEDDDPNKDDTPSNTGPACVCPISIITPNAIAQRPLLTKYPVYLSSTP